MGGIIPNEKLVDFVLKMRTVRSEGEIGEDLEVQKLYSEVSTSNEDEVPSHKKVYRFSNFPNEF